MPRGKTPPVITPGEAQRSTQDGTDHQACNTEHQVHCTSPHGWNVGRDSHRENKKTLCTKDREQPPRNRPLLRATTGSNFPEVTHDGRVTKPRSSQELGTLELLDTRAAHETRSSERERN